MTPSALRHTTFLLTLSACISVVPPVPPTTEQLHNSCVEVPIDADACLTLADRYLADPATVNKGLQYIGSAARARPDQYTRLGHISLDGSLVPPNEKHAQHDFMLGCTEKQPESCAWEAALSIKLDRSRFPTPHWRSCPDTNPSAWGCFNYAVAMSCGLIEMRNPVDAKHAMGRGCRAGYAPACDAVYRMDADASPLPCDMITSDPKSSYKLTFPLTPTGFTPKVPAEDPPQATEVQR